MEVCARTEAPFIPSLLHQGLHDSLSSLILFQREPYEFRVHLHPALQLPHAHSMTFKKYIFLSEAYLHSISPFFPLTFHLFYFFHFPHFLTSGVFYTLQASAGLMNKLVSVTFSVQKLAYINWSESVFLYSLFDSFLQNINQ